MKGRIDLATATERVRAILNAEDLSIGFAICLPGEPKVLITGGGDEAQLTLPVARVLLDALRPVWGDADADVRRLQSVLCALEPGE